MAPVAFARCFFFLVFYLFCSSPFFLWLAAPNSGWKYRPVRHCFSTRIFCVVRVLWFTATVFIAYWRPWCASAREWTRFASRTRKWSRAWWGKLLFFVSTFMFVALGDCGRRGPSHENGILRFQRMLFCRDGRGRRFMEGRQKQVQGAYIHIRTQTGRIIISCFCILDHATMWLTKGGSANCFVFCCYIWNV